jgi:hypothetical protein
MEGVVHHLVQPNPKVVFDPRCQRRSHRIRVRPRSRQPTDSQIHGQRVKIQFLLFT